MKLMSTMFSINNGFEKGVWFFVHISNKECHQNKWAICSCSIKTKEKEVTFSQTSEATKWTLCIFKSDQLADSPFDKCISLMNMNRDTKILKNTTQYVHLYKYILMVTKGLTIFDSLWFCILIIYSPFLTRKPIMVNLGDFDNCVYCTLNLKLCLSSEVLFYTNCLILKTIQCMRWTYLYIVTMNNTNGKTVY